MIPTPVPPPTPYYHNEIFDRYGLALKFGLIIHYGIINYDFRGVVRVVVFNYSNKDFKILSCERIAQFLIKQHESVKFIETTE